MLEKERSLSMMIQHIYNTTLIVTTNSKRMLNTHFYQSITVQLQIIRSCPFNSNSKTSAIWAEQSTAALNASQDAPYHLFKLFKFNLAKYISTAKGARHSNHGAFSKPWWQLHNKPINQTIRYCVLQDIAVFIGCFNHRIHTSQSQHQQYTSSKLGREGRWRIQCVKYNIRYMVLSRAIFMLDSLI